MMTLVMMMIMMMNPTTTMAMMLVMYGKKDEQQNVSTGKLSVYLKIIRELYMYMGYHGCG